MDGTSSDVTMRLVLATYNIHRCVGWDRRYDPGRVADVLKELEADVIALQEVDSPTHRGLQLLHWFSEETKMRAIAGPTLVEHKGHYGNAVLTTCATHEVRLIDLSFGAREPRGAIDVDLRCDGGRMQVIATHLGLRPAERRFQVERLLTQFGAQHCLLMGDLNEWFLWGKPLRLIKKIFGHAPALPTFPAFSPVFALDRIWVRPPGTLVRLSVHRTTRSLRASDHLPLKAIVEW
jgi:endonuclease/exonuclease/phosphatase family metal-dependent hydrolase